jgi:hypothetical protein
VIAISGHIARRKASEGGLHPREEKTCHCAKERDDEPRDLFFAPPA